MSDPDFGINERTLEYLGAVEKHGGMRAAADFLGVNASTISRQIAAIERQIRLPLLTRSGRTVALTQVGQAVVEYGRERDRQTKRFFGQLDEYRGLRRGRVAVGAGEGIVNSLIVNVLKNFSHKYPNIMVEIRTGPLPELIQMVRDDIVDICVSIGTAHDPLLNSRLFQSLPLCAIVSIEHPLSKRSSLRMSELIGERLIFMSREFALQTYIEAIMQDEGMSVVPAYRCDLFSITLSLASQNLGIAFMTLGAAYEKVQSGKVVAIPLDHPIAKTFDRYVATRVGRKLDPAANFLWREIVRLMDTSNNR